MTPKQFLQGRGLPPGAAVPCPGCAARLSPLSTTEPAMPPYLLAPQKGRCDKMLEAILGVPSWALGLSALALLR